MEHPQSSIRVMSSRSSDVRSCGALRTARLVWERAVDRTLELEPMLKVFVTRDCNLCGQPFEKMAVSTVAIQWPGETWPMTSSPTPETAAGTDNARHTIAIIVSITQSQPVEKLPLKAWCRTTEISDPPR